MCTPGKRQGGHALKGYVLRKFGMSVDIKLLRSHMKKSTKVSLGVAGGLVIIGAIAGCNSNSSTASTSGSPAVPASASSASTAAAQAPVPTTQAPVPTTQAPVPTTQPSSTPAM